MLQVGRTKGAGDFDEAAGDAGGLLWHSRQFNSDAASNSFLCFDTPAPYYQSSVRKSHSDYVQQLQCRY
jgi:hypothetical protein